MSFWRKKKEEPDKKRRFGSFAFYLAIPATLFFASFLFAETYLFTQVRGFNKSDAAFFLHAFLAGAVVCSSLQVQRLRTLIHEFKHAALVVLTGNKITEISIGKGEGHVTYEAYEGTTHLEPFVVLAPYFFPFFSFPIFVAAMIFEGYGKTPFLYALGFFFAVDLFTAFKEMHGLQSDLKRVYGGFLATRSFIFGFHLLWSSLVFLWIVGGRAGYGFILETLSIAATVLSNPN